MPSVSIIHAPRDEALGEQIAAALASAGHVTTRISSDPAIGDLGEVGLDDSTAIVVWTKAAAKLLRLREQALEAMTRGALIPVAVGGARPPGGFENLPAVDLSGWTGAPDDPRWRFVLEEIQLAQSRTLLQDGAVWAEPQNDAAPTPVAQEPYTDEVDELPPFLARPKPPLRFSARQVAIGATVGLVAMTVVTALLAPVLLPAPQVSRPPIAKRDPAPASNSATPQSTAAIPDPSPSRAENLGVLTLGPAPGDATASGEDAPLIVSQKDAAPAIVEQGDDVEPSALEAATGDTNAIDTVPADAISADVGADSEAMHNLVAAVIADEGTETIAAASVDPLPDEVAEKTYLGNYFKECIECPDMAALPAGTFRMGAGAGETERGRTEGPAHPVTIAQRFAIGTREVTYAQWDACVADGGCKRTPSDHGWGRGARPAVSVSYLDAQEYIAWLSAKTGRAYRLPSEAEWEYAARGGSDQPFGFSGKLSPKRANYNGNYPYRGPKGAFRAKTTEAASFAPNAFGLFDMHGNAWEWTQDCWAATHQGAPADGSPNASGDCSKRVLKGGAWNTGGWRLRAAHRIGKPQTTREFDNGFRVARDLD